MSVTELLEAIRAVVGPRGLLTDPADTAPYCEDWRRLYQGRTPAVIRPADTAELAAVVRLCAAGAARRWCRRAEIPRWSAARRPMPMAASWCSAWRG